jgi:hypothetical protein
MIVESVQAEFELYPSKTSFSSFYYLVTSSFYYLVLTSCMSLSFLTTTDECTIKKSDSNGFSEGFSYNTFKTIEGMCTDCSTDDICEDMVGDSVTCVDGYAVNYDNGDDDDDGIDDNRLCKLYKQASRERQYATVKRDLKILPFVFLLLLVGGFFVSGAYTYFMRHKRAAAVLLEKDDGDLNDSPKGTFTQMS